MALTDIQKERVWEMRVREGKSHGQIALALGVSRNVVVGYVTRQGLVKGLGKTRRPAPKPARQPKPRSPKPRPVAEAGEAAPSVSWQDRMAVQLVAWLADHATRSSIRPSNRELGQAHGIDDPGRVSHLLGRAVALGLIKQPGGQGHVDIVAADGSWVLRSRQVIRAETLPPIPPSLRGHVDGSEKQLACAVITMAFDDMMGRGTQHAGERRDAKSFLLDTHGMWARQRRIWCERAGIDEGGVVAKARAYVASRVGAVAVPA